MGHTHPTGAATVTVKCKGCGSPFQARVADRNRGWGKFCSKSCKAIKQTQHFASGANPKGYERHDGLSEMKHKVCDTCGAPAINGVYGLGGRIEWGCFLHHDTSHPFSSDALGQS